MKPIWSFLIACSSAALLCPTVQAALPEKLLVEHQSADATVTQLIDPIELEPIAESTLPSTEAQVVEVNPEHPAISDGEPEISDLPSSASNPEIPTNEDAVAPDSEVENPELEQAESVEAEPKPDLENGEAPSSTGEDEDAIAPDSPTDDPNSPSEAEPATTLANEGRQQLLIEADRLYLQGQYEQAEFLYRKAKEPFIAEAVRDRPAAISDPALLSPAGQVYWREANAGREAELYTRLMVPLELLVEEYPEFIPGHLLHAEVLAEQDKPEESLAVLERATTLYPNEPELIQARVEALADNERWLEASIAARQFALLNPERPDVAEFQTLADQHLEEFQERTRSRLRGNAIANFVTGAASFVLTGNLFGPLSAIETTVLMLRGESAVGESIANQATRQLELVEDEAIVAYVNELGQRLAEVSGRDDFEYEFYVVQDETLNAFALPGGKIFVNAGAILEANSEAELAGLLAHELSHAVLSHGFQLVTSGNLTANLLQFIPYGGYAANLAVLSYSRDMERQADALGTRILATSGYAADGLRNLMITLEEAEEESLPFIWLSSHPDADERIENIETQIELNGYNRYTYEGVERHQAMQQRVEQLLLAPDEAK
ncbi:M48 family metalloprotease [Leptolyngbya sp. FACHB-671]|uniref:M48 family metallopeptidase n=1 Tax=Leptolyngbya sp. FACHB-671 TaxID=2692812 RepID=UPI0016843084|nr:M48 family metallopeptidase [Leptolyngbya sp. FACHB-671]MBD2071047.1 M48 family metalloprotease [Leptolyngbya sp. FACHB-671]